MNKSDAGEFALGRALRHRKHQLPPDGVILHGGIDRDRPYAGNRIALVEKIAADDPAAQLRNHGIEARVGKHHRDHACGAPS